MNTGLRAFFPAAWLILLPSSQAAGRGGGGGMNRPSHNPSDPGLAFGK
jgi:hypothetical protein